MLLLLAGTLVEVIPRYFTISGVLGCTVRILGLYTMIEHHRNLVDMDTNTTHNQLNVQNHVHIRITIRMEQSKAK